MLQERENIMFVGVCVSWGTRLFSPESLQPAAVKVLTVTHTHTHTHTRTHTHTWTTGSIHTRSHLVEPPRSVDCIYQLYNEPVAKPLPLDLVSSYRGLRTRPTSSNGGVSSLAIIKNFRWHFRTLICQMIPLLDSDREQIFSGRLPLCS